VPFPILDKGGFCLIALSIARGDRVARLIRLTRRSGTMVEQESRRELLESPSSQGLGPEAGGSGFSPKAGAVSYLHRHYGVSAIKATPPPTTRVAIIPVSSPSFHKG
jgi:hypothetical protein